MKTTMMRFLGVAAATAVVALPLTACSTDGVGGIVGKKEATTAKTSSDFSDVCEGGAIENAAAYDKPYKILAFVLDTSGPKERWKTTYPSFRETWSVENADFAQANAVVCLKLKAGSEKKVKTCPYQVKGKQIDLGLYSAEYEATAYEAKSGKKVTDLGTVAGTAEKCPSMVFTNPDDPREVAQPDRDALTSMFNSFAAG